MIKFHWHGRWCFTRKSCTDGNMTCKRVDVFPALFPGGLNMTSDRQLTAFAKGKHATHVAKESDATLLSAVNCSSAPCTPIHRIGTHLNSAVGSGLNRTSCALPATPSPSWLLYTLDTFFQQISNGDKMICIKFLPGSSRSEFM